MNQHVRTLIIALATFTALGRTLVAEEAKALATTANSSSNSDADKPAKKIEWTYLAPENGRPFNDPFAKLTSDQRADLSYILRIRRLIGEEKIEANGDDAEEAIRLGRKLQQQGIDVNWHFAQIQRIPQLRRQQIDEVSKSIAKSVGSETVTLVGYAIPVRTQDDLAVEFLVTPTLATCSHATEPSPLYVVSVKSERGFPLSPRGTPVRVQGVFSAEANSTRLMTAGGVQNILSAYKIIPSTVELLDWERDDM